MERPIMPKPKKATRIQCFSCKPKRLNMTAVTEVKQSASKKMKYD